MFGIHSSLSLEREPDFSSLNSISGLIHDYTFDYRYRTVASYYTLLPHRATHGDLFVKLSWCCIFRCYGHYYNVIFALTATSLFRKQLHRRTCLSCSSYWWQIFTNNLNDVWKNNKIGKREKHLYGAFMWWSGTL